MRGNGPALLRRRGGVLALEPPWPAAPARAGAYDTGKCVQCNTAGDNQNDCLALGYRQLSPEFQALAAQLPQLASAVPAIDKWLTTCKDNVCVRPATCTSSNQCPDATPICEGGVCVACKFASDKGLPCLARAALMGTTAFQCELAASRCWAAAAFGAPAARAVLLTQLPGVRAGGGGGTANRDKPWALHQGLQPCVYGLRCGALPTGDYPEYGGTGRCVECNGDGVSQNPVDSSNDCAFLIK